MAELSLQRNGHYGLPTGAGVRGKPGPVRWQKGGSQKATADNLTFPWKILELLPSKGGTFAAVAMRTEFPGEASVSRIFYIPLPLPLELHCMHSGDGSKVVGT